MVRNVDEFRQKIDRGVAGDKVAVVDPAAAPLGTDDEAGHSMSAAQIALAHDQEFGRESSDAGPERPRGYPTAWLWVVGVAVVTGVAAMLGFWV